MKFIDEIEIIVDAGKGGDGIMSFHREKYVNKGGPDGGNGGNGGSIYFQGESGLNTLFFINNHKTFKGHNGKNGSSKNRHGSNGKDIIIKVPLGTLVVNKKNNMVICDVIDTKKYLIAQGGQGGKGNHHFKSPLNQAPRIFEKGTYGQKYTLLLNLKVIADIGLIGKPSAGKSTILSTLSHAKPKIGNYDFTTLEPHLGLAKYQNHFFTIADLPGIIKGAHLGKGLGLKFLKHIDRCKMIAQIIDFGDENKDPAHDFQIIQKELQAYPEYDLTKKVKIIIANKSDLKNFQKNFQNFQKQFPDLKILPFSSFEKNNQKREKLLANFWQIIDQNPDQDLKQKKQKEITITLEEDIIIKKILANVFQISGSAIWKIYQKIPLNTFDNILRFNKKMKNLGVWKELKKQGIREGDNINIFDYEFVWEEKIKT